VEEVGVVEDGDVLDVLLAVMNVPVLVVVEEDEAEEDEEDAMLVELAALVAEAMIDPDVAVLVVDEEETRVLATVNSEIDTYAPMTISVVITKTSVARLVIQDDGKRLTR
jgi:hypothetical protein